jgi:hydrogenase maturation protein HypF
MTRIASSRASRDSGSPATAPPGGSVPRRTNRGNGVAAAAVQVRGVVQGVGFRPFVHRVAARHGLAGWVRNEAGSVRIHVEGPAPALDRFIAALRAEAPPLARLDTVEVESVQVRGLDAFEVGTSRAESAGRLPVSPDVSLCDACAAELLNPDDRRYHYPFITCTDCGPRFTVIEAMPYDRERTTMRRFQQCRTCLAEYREPGDRRYHSETNSCPECGPRLWLADPSGSETHGGEEALEHAAWALGSGRIVAIRGLGGFHLAADATSETGVTRLRERKRRDAKPLAVMVRNLEGAARIAAVGPEEERALLSRERPVVLLRRRADAGLAPSVAPGLDTIGVMLPYTPLHLLLLDLVRRPLVMTSGNVSEEPIVTAVPDAIERFRDIADHLLLHDREIVARYDDSVVRFDADGHRILIRRARGFAPLPLRLPVPAPRPLLAVGPHLKNTFTLATGDAAYVSQHVGDLENLETLEHFRDARARFEALFRITAEIAVRDLHPGYLSTREAESLGLERILVVQHHHAHIAAVAGEHGVTRPVVGLAFDGTGLGDDGAVWGAEALVSDLVSYRRVGGLRYAPLPGGDLAARRPWRAALGYLALEPALEPAFRLAFEGVSPEELRLARLQAQRGINAPRASSMGRLFDAAAAVLGVRLRSEYEGQAPMELEALAGRAPARPLPFPLVEEDGRHALDPVPLLAALGQLRQTRPAEALAARFHESVAAGATALAVRACEESALDTVALGGGVFQNARLTASLRRRLQERGLAVLEARELGPNDGAISYGQAVVAAARLTTDEGG